MRELMLLKVVKYFLENPYEEVYLRELARILKLSTFAAKKYADLLVQENLIKEERRANLRYFKANTSSIVFRYLKIAFKLNSISKSGLVDFLKENLANVSSIVLFGSMAKGEDNKESDTDILVIGKQKHLNLHEFEKEINREITLHIFSWSEWNKKLKQDKAFYFEIISYGIPLYGELPLIR